MAEQLLEKDRQKELLAVEVCSSFTLNNIT
jgi:hypothetical protein